MHLVMRAPPTCYPCYVQVHLLVDTTLTNGKFSINAFMSRLLTLGDKVGASAGGARWQAEAQGQGSAQGA